MRLLLDTHAALWWLTGDRPIGAAALELLADDANEVLLSAAIVWEVAIKRSLGKLEAPPGFAQTLIGGGARPLAISLEHAAGVERLAWHHRDPFDRVLVAQALDEGAVLISADPRLQAYQAEIVW